MDSILNPLNLLTITLESRYNEPVYCEEPGITNDMFHTSNGKMYE